MAENEIYRVEIPIIVDDQSEAPLSKARERVNKFEKDAQKQNERIRQHFQKIAKLQIEPVMRVRDQLTNSVLKADRLIKKLGVEQASPVIAAQDRVSAVVTRIDAALKALDRGDVKVVADMQGPLMDEIIKAKAALKGLEGVKAGPVAELRGELFSQLTKAMSQVKGLDSLMAQPEATLRERVTWKAREIGSTLRSLTSRVWNITLGIKDTAFGAVRRLTSILTSPLGLLGAGAGIYGLGEATLGAAASTELQLTTLETLLRDQKRAQEYMNWAMKEAAETMFSDVEMMTTALSLAPYARTDMNLFKEYVKTAEILAAINPTEGLAGGAFALREALSGDFVSLQERFNLPRSVINNLKEGATTAKDYLQVVLKAAESMGYTYELVKRQGKTAVGLWSTITGNINALFRKTGEGILESMKPRLQKIVDWFEKNVDTVERWKRALARLGREGADRILDFFERTFSKLADIMESDMFQKADIIGKLSMLLGTGIPEIAEKGAILGARLGKSIAKGLGEAIAADPYTALTFGILAGVLTPGPIHLKAVIAVSISALPWIKNFLEWLMGETPKKYAEIKEAVTKYHTIPGTAAYAEAKIQEITRETAGAWKWFEEKSRATPAGEPLIPGGELRAVPHATGGIYNNPHVGLIAERGIEALIPISARMRNRGIDLWHKVGLMLGTLPMSTSMDGFAGSVPMAVPAMAGVASFGAPAVTAGPINVTLNVSASGGQDVLQAIRANYKVIADEISDAVANGLKSVYQNMTK